VSEAITCDTPPQGDLVFTVAATDEPLLTFCVNGDIFIQGRLAENDKAVVEAFREWLHVAQAEGGDETP